MTLLVQQPNYWRNEERCMRFTKPLKHNETSLKSIFLIVKKARGQVQVGGGEDTIERHGNTGKFD